MREEEIRVGISDYKIANAPNKLITIGLGSCVGIALYDKRKKKGALIHIMLPSSKQFDEVVNPIKFGDLAINVALSKMMKEGSYKSDVVAKIAGGASMFNFSDAKMISDIGSRNISSVKEELKKLNIPVIAEDVGGKKGRTMTLYTETGVVEIKTIGEGIKEF